MDSQRKRGINIDAVLKVQKFLELCKKNIEKGIIFSPTDLAVKLHTSRMVFKHSIELGVLKRGEIKGEFFLGENFGTDRNTAKKIIETRRLSELNKKQKKDLERAYSLKDSLDSAPTLNEINSGNQDSLPEFKSNTAQEIASILKKSIPTSPSQSIFSDQEKEFEDKLKIACAIASGVYSHKTIINGMLQNLNNDIPIEGIIRTTNEIYSKLKNNK